MKYTWATQLITVLALLGIWAIASSYIPSFLLPSPIATIKKIIQVLFSVDFATNAYHTLSKIIISTSIAFVFSNFLAYVSYKKRSLELLTKPLVFIGLQTPTVVAVFIGIILLGTSGPVAITVSSIILFYELYVILLPAYQGLKQEYIELGIVYKIPKYTILKRVIIPQLLPSEFVAIRLGLSLGWKLNLVSEVFGLGIGVGYQIQRYFSLFSILGVLSWFISFVIVLSVIEYGIIIPLEKKLNPALWMKKI